MPSACIGKHIFCLYTQSSFVHGQLELSNDTPHQTAPYPLRHWIFIAFLSLYNVTRKTFTIMIFPLIQWK